MLDHEIAEFSNLPLKEVILKTAQNLTTVQEGESRNLQSEHCFARAINNLLHKGDNQDFMICAEIIASKIFFTKNYPYSWGKGRSYISVTGGLTEIHLEKVDTYLYGFYTGIELGYEETLNGGWCLLLGDAIGFYYIPVTTVESVTYVSY